MLKACIGLKQVDYLDRRHCGLPGIPEDVYRHERTLEELLLDFNAIQDLPPKFFRLTSLRKLTISENDLNRIPPGIANLTRLVELDISKNAIEDVPQNMQFCRSLHFLDISSNPLLRTPEGITSIVSLTHLNLNDVGIARLPVDIGNLAHLKVLEVRENVLKVLPSSIGNMKKLQRLDVGNNEIEHLPAEIGQLLALAELWVDTNLLSELPETLTKVRNLMVLDVTKNRLEYLPADFSALSNLCDLHISENILETLPQDMGRMQALTLLKLDINHLVQLPASIGQLHLVTELLLYDNMLESVPPSLFEMRSLEMLNLDRNHLLEIPSTIGRCKTLHVLSLRENELCELPEEMGHLPNLKVLDIINNRIKNVPLSFSNLDLDAFWIDGSQPQPLVCLEPHPDPDNPEVNKLYCPFLPQRAPCNSSMENFLEGGSVTSGENSTFQSSSLNRTGSFGKGARLAVAFDPALGPAPEDASNKLVRFPTPFRKDMKALKAKRKKGKYKPEATPSTTIFRKGSASSRDDLTLLSVNASETSHSDELKKSHESLGGFGDVLTEYEEEPGRGLSKSKAVENLSQEDLVELNKEDKQTAKNGTESADVLREAMYADDSSELPSGSVVRSIDVAIDIDKVPGRTLGFSIAGGRGSTPAYEDVDDSIYVTKIAMGGLAEQDGRLRLGDKLLSVNGINMVNATHAESVAALKSVTTSCQLVVSREVLVVLPDEAAKEGGDEVGQPPALPAAIEEGEEGGGSESEVVAKQMVADVLDRSLNRLNSVEPLSPASPSGRQHDNYINFDIAQIVVKESRNDDPGIISPEESPMHTVRKPWEEEEARPTHRRSHPSVSMSIDDEEEDYPVERVVLDRSVGRLGLSIVGGADHVSRVFGQGRPGVYVSKISKGGAAKATGKLRLGDRILEVNKFNVRFSTHQQAVQWLISQEGDIELVVQHVPQPPGLQTILLKKGPNQKLGLSIRGGGKGSKGNPLDPNDEGIFISKLTLGGAAESSGKLAIGMRIVEVNGISLLGASHTQAVKALRSSEDLLITVCDGFDVEEAKKRKSIAEALEDDRISSVTTRSHVPLSAASSLVLDKAIHGLLSESVDALPARFSTGPRKSARSYSAVAPANFSLLHSNLSQSSAAIVDAPVTREEDFDGVLEDLARYKLETSLSLKKLNEGRDTSSPQASPIPLSDIIGPLQDGGGLESGLFTEEDLMVKPSIEDELSEVEVKDTPSMLAALDSEVTLMQGEVTQGEDEIKKVQEAKDGDATPTQQRQRKSSRHLKVSKPVDPTQASPETRRRAEQIRINISPPPDAEASEAAVKSIIGEVFSDISFEEFEKDSATPSQRSQRSSGVFTPPSEPSQKSKRDSKVEMQEVLSALKEMATTSTKDASSSESLEGDEPEPCFGDVPPVKERARTMPALAPVESAPPVTDHTHNEVTLRVHSSTSDPNWRKSAPNPETYEKPKSLVSPEKLTFKEKLALHKKVADVLPPPPVTRQGSGGDARSKSIFTVDPTTVPPPVNRTTSDGKTTSPTISSPSLPSTFSDRIAFLRNNQAKAGMEPVEVKMAAHGDRRMSAEERRMARIVKSDDQMESTDAASPLHTAASNSNNNNSIIHAQSNPCTAPISPNTPSVAQPPTDTAQEGGGMERDPQEEKEERYKKFDDFLAGVYQVDDHGTPETRKKAPTTLV